MSGAGIAALVDSFSELTGSIPAGVMRAPGRVNIIGEHVDYNGFAVLPMALDRDISGAFAPRRDGVVGLASLDVPGSRSFRISETLSPYATGDWGNYAKAAVQGLVERYGVRALQGVDILVSSGIPPSAGLSSSSALVVLISLIVLHVSRILVDRLELAELLARAERYTGTQGGGMDQAACLMGRRGSALRVSFDPLAVRPHPVPKDHSFVVAHSLVSASKSEMQGYNLRAAECRLAAAVLSERLGRPVEKLADLGCDHYALKAIRSELHSEPYGERELVRTIGDALESNLTQRDGRRLQTPEGGYALRQRAEHVVTEAARVEETCAAFAAGDALRVGRLMNESHKSCRDLFQISCPQLDRLTALALEAGALGSRLTGAGFGGCTVNLVPNARVSGFLQRLGECYYAGSAPGDLQDCLFVAQAADGAGTVRV